MSGTIFYLIGNLQLYYPTMTMVSNTNRLNDTYTSHKVSHKIRTIKRPCVKINLGKT